MSKKVSVLGKSSQSYFSSRPWLRMMVGQEVDRRCSQGIDSAAPESCRVTPTHCSWRHMNVNFVRRAAYHAGADILTAWNMSQSPLMSPSDRLRQAANNCVSSVYVPIYITYRPRVSSACSNFHSFSITRLKQSYRAYQYPFFAESTPGDSLLHLCPT